MDVVRQVSWARVGVVVLAACLGGPRAEELRPAPRRTPPYALWIGCTEDRR